MTEFDNSNRGVLFVNDRKENEKHSDYNGTALIVSPGGETFEMWVNGYKRKGKSGKTFLSLSFKVKSNGQSGGTSSESSTPSIKASKPKKSVEESLDDEIPF